MTRNQLIAAAVLIGTAAVALPSASDRIGVYAKIDRVVFEPNATAPETAQIWGVFSIAERNNPNDYRPAARGYLYYRLPSNQGAARREWADLAKVAGTSQVVAFGNRWEGTPKLHAPDDKPADPEPYAINTGVTKVTGNTQYAPVRALLEFKP